MSRNEEQLCNTIFISMATMLYCLASHGLSAWSEIWGQSADRSGSCILKGVVSDEKTPLISCGAVLLLQIL